MDSTIIPTDAVVLVTNATQPIPLQVVKQLLECGCRVRAATACDEDGSWMSELFAMHAYSGRFEHIKLSHDDSTDSSHYEDAVNGVYAIVHSPMVAYLNQPPKDVWAKTADSVLSMLDAAKGEKSVQAFVYTSSIVAVTSLSTPSEAPVLVTEDSWNAKDVVLALTGKHNDHIIHDSALVYTEQSLWHWQDKQCPHFKINVISPSNLIGQNFAPHRTSDWQNWLLELYRNGQATEVIPNAGPTQAHWYVDVADVALLHVAAIFDPDIAGERLHAWGCFRDWNDAIAVMRNLEPDVPDVTQPFFIGDDGSKRGGLYTRPGRVPAILKKWNRGEGWKPFETTVAESVEMFRNMGHTMGGMKQ